MNTAYVYEAWKHNSWGNRIGIWDWDAGKLEGHLPRKPRVGDRIRFQMKSGQILETEVTEVKTFIDPPDQFIATVKELGYVTAN